MRLLGNRNEAGRGWVPLRVVSLGAGGELVDELSGAGHRVWRPDLRGLPDVVRGMRTLRRILEAEGVDALVAWPYPPMLLSVMPGVVPSKTRVVWMVRGSMLRRGDRSSTRLLVRVCAVGAARADVIV